jgi:NAD(P)-dependent dehydrogenase (short-subunit alcohol dehydrogenase family)
MNPFDFTDKHVFVAGGTAGINLGIAEGFARAGARVAVCSRAQDKVTAAAKTLNGDAPEGTRALGFACDVRDFARVSEVLKQATDAFGPIDVLVSGAAGNFPAPASALSSNGFKAVVDIDLVGTFHVLRAAYPHLKRPGASVINISAQQASQAVAFQVHVCAAKAGVDQVTRVLALEWGPEGIRVNSISPGPIADTGGMDRLAPKSGFAAGALGEVIPLGRIGLKEDIAQCALFLSSPWASYITGVVLPVDGGMSLNGGGLFAQVVGKALAEQQAAKG